ncbi:MAG: asparagine synthase (glutamine-hydrolyzing), partial [Chitinispirillia bacterium]
MCGICGYYSYKNKIIKDLPSLIKKMTNTLKHRGPDEEGYFVSNNIALGHRRLSIIDLEGGKQPIYNEDKTKIIIFNGEIYNYKEIQRDLKIKGHCFTTNSDTETILHLYEDVGKECVKKLRGMFSFVIYDKKNHSLFAARDRLGIKPFYYSFEDGEFIFGSEIKALLASTKISKKIDFESLSDYLTYLYIPAPKSIFSMVKKLPAGYTLIIENGTMSLSQYWDIDFSQTKKFTENEWIDILNNIIYEAVKLRMISEVPLGGFLSGGVDSSCIIGIMSRLSNTPIITNSIGFKEAAFSELEYARQISRYFRTNHNEYTVSMNCSEILDKLAWYFDEPFADSSALPTYYVSKMTRANVTVALSGDGGDENFAGYRRYYYDKLENNIRKKIPGFLRKTFIRLFAQLY